jgi:hypothetical protein
MRYVIPVFIGSPGGGGGPPLPGLGGGLPLLPLCPNAAVLNKNRTTQMSPMKYFLFMVWGLKALKSIHLLQI